MRVLARAVGIVVAGALGIAVGVLGAFVHGMSARVLDVSLAIGVLPALAGLAALLVLTGLTLRSRLALLAPAVGWAAAVFPLAAPRPEGDLVVASTVAGYVFLLGGALLIGMCMTVPYGATAAHRLGRLPPAPHG